MSLAIARYVIGFALAKASNVVMHRHIFNHWRLKWKDYCLIHYALIGLGETKETSCRGRDSETQVEQVATVGKEGTQAQMWLFLK